MITSLSPHPHRPLLHSLKLPNLPLQQRQSVDIIRIPQPSLLRVDSRSEDGIPVLDNPLDDWRSSNEDVLDSRSESTLFSLECCQTNTPDVNIPCLLIGVTL
jgi:hypothetical protein